MQTAPPFDYYQELEVGPTAALADIVRAYRRLSRIHHPDKTTGGGGSDKTAAATAKMARLNHARDVLTNAEERRRYDESLQEPWEEEQHAAGDEGWNSEDYQDMDEMDCDEEPEDDIARYAPVDDPTLEGDVSGDFGLGGYSLWEQQNQGAEVTVADEDEDEDEEMLFRLSPDSSGEQVVTPAQTDLDEQPGETFYPTLDALEEEERLWREQKTKAKMSLRQTLAESIKGAKRRTQDRGLLPRLHDNHTAAGPPGRV